MKKTKVLVPAVALLALGMAASTTATVAWFSASQATKEVVGTTGSVTAISGSASASKFTISTSVGTITNGSTVYLTNDEGKTKVIVGSSNVEINPTGGNAYATAPVTVTVTYAGSAATHEDVEAEFAVALTSAITITVADETVYDNDHNFSADMISAAAANKGLKFWTSAPSAASDWVLSTHKTTGSFSIAEATAEAATFSGSNGAFTATFDVQNVLVGIQGLDSIEQDSDDAYSFSVTPSATGFSAPAQQNP